ncbi:LOW QUALITY PROTEIN: hypothetical protein RJ641_011244 [Dillenia turbinata]|uniref:Protein kinase domain-containing protein n=1 Tax=Dillenia turbinata TaxID=194707 RepID=A0AAN8UW21_9MAGN
MGIIEDPFGKVLNSWIISSSDSTLSCPWSWTGIESDETGSVSAVFLNRLGLAEDLKLSTLIGLKMLKNLSLSGNSFIGFYVHFAVLRSVQESLFGQIPDELFMVKFLEAAWLSPDRLTGELFFMLHWHSLLSSLLGAPAEVLGRSTHGTLYKTTLDNGHMLTVKWLWEGLVKRKREFAKEVKRIGSMRHPNIVSLQAYYWGPREQERDLSWQTILKEIAWPYIFMTTTGRHFPLSFNQRLKVAVEMGHRLAYLHDRELPHGNL